MEDSGERVELPQFCAQFSVGFVVEFRYPKLGFVRNPIYLFESVKTIVDDAASTKSILTMLEGKKGNTDLP